jgi:hypothetical protein
VRVRRGWLVTGRVQSVRLRRGLAGALRSPAVLFSTECPPARPSCSGSDGYAAWAFSNGEANADIESNAEAVSDASATYPNPLLGGYAGTGETGGLLGML